MLKGLNSAVTVHIVFDSCLRSSSFERNPQLAVLLFNTYLPVLLFTVKCFATNAYQLMPPDDDVDDEDWMPRPLLTNLLILYATYRFYCRPHAVKFTRVTCVKPAFSTSTNILIFYGIFKNFLEMNCLLFNTRTKPVQWLSTWKTYWISLKKNSKTAIFQNGGCW